MFLESVSQARNTAKDFFNYFLIHWEKETNRHPKNKIIRLRFSLRRKSRSGFADMSAVAHWRRWKPEMPGLGKAEPTENDKNVCFKFFIRSIF